MLSTFVRSHPGVRLPARGTNHWLAFASGPFGYWALVAAQGQLRAEAYLDCGDAGRNKRLFDDMAAGSAHWEAGVGVPLSWERLDDKRACRIAAYHPLDLDDPSSRASAKEWALATLDKMFAALNTEPRNRAKAIRQAGPPGAISSGGADGNDHDERAPREMAGVEAPVDDAVVPQPNAEGTGSFG